MKNGTLYLIEANGYLKVGFALDLEKRLKAYKTHNPKFQVIATKEGIRLDETFLHRLFKQYLTNGEWMKYNIDIIDLFKYTAVPSSYFMVFDEFITVIKDLKSNANSILMWMCCNMEFNSNRIHLSKLSRKLLAKETGICIDTISNNLTNLRKLKLIIKDNLDYIINPLFFWKGELEVREKFLKNHFILFSGKNLDCPKPTTEERKVLENKKINFKINMDDLRIKYGDLSDKELIDLAFKELDNMQ